jgi:hypothetical protein
VFIKQRFRKVISSMVLVLIRLSQYFTKFIARYLNKLGFGFLARPFDV